MVWPLLLIFVGGVFLLQNTGYLPQNFWVNLWRLWPVVLVLVGVELLLSQRIHWLVLTLLAAVVLVCSALIVNSSMQGPPVAFTTRSATTTLGGATQAAVTLRFDAGQLDIGPLVEPTAADQLATMSYTGPGNVAPAPTYAVSNGTGQLDYQISDRDRPQFLPFMSGQADRLRFDLNLSPTVPITTLSIRSGATDAHLDLSSLHINNLDLNLGAASAVIRLPEAAGRTTARINGGASSITLEIPQGVAAQIRHRGGLSSVTVDQSRFPQVGEGLYRSPDFASATNSVDVTLDTGVTSIQVS